MGWAFCGTDGTGRDIGYGVPATCDHEDCEACIDRGLGYCCGDMHGGTEHGCGRYFCGEHLFYGAPEQLCGECLEEYEKAHPEDGQGAARDPGPIA